MKFILPALTIFASLAVAKNCQEGLNYCSFTLMGKGDYHQQILKAIDEYGTDPRTVNYDYFLYHCDGGSNGSIHVVDTCSKGCHDGGDNKSDSCL
ncbi:hypothetical protein N7499_012290 [Penicillium canescens]|uniref:Uncharacterized protein n=1 Tax=Penicillium canescens TaxID=5083 RepID=A0AAD6N4B7_PENCN|nr:uncharacterized protein N7446_001063 [Penicillium canescens]KAJ6013106.1 hypothetical protein N7522_003461 [Penicillium canescens]KAJ6029874.1 hypothetical protein N7460_010140 [Penicillium canescens]KAJ6060256.1 hypothetical protein N7444_002110 [Penicillium canescens]KAJ6063610.1 hypothetical protein N7499_012290 [Penicillium canescens]KAJ6078127.1 hypothetical protein N7446_001063 [Penicillium canescens]